MRTQIATNVSLTTRRQADELVKYCGYSMRDVVTLGVAELYRSELDMITHQKEKRLVQLIKDADNIHWADREARNQAEDKISEIGGPFFSGLFSFNDEEKPTDAALRSYREALDSLNMVGSDERNSDLGQHYQRMIGLLTPLK